MRESSDGFQRGCYRSIGASGGVRARRGAAMRAGIGRAIVRFAV
jgi:hypothetical protein